MTTAANFKLHWRHQEKNNPIRCSKGYTVCCQGVTIHQIMGIKEGKKMFYSTTWSALYSIAWDLIIIIPSENSSPLHLRFCEKKCHITSLPTTHSPIFLHNRARTDSISIRFCCLNILLYAVVMISLVTDLYYCNACWVLAEIRAVSSGCLELRRSVSNKSKYVW